MLTQTCSQGKMKAEIRVMPVTSRWTPEIIRKTPEARGEALRSLLRALAEGGLPQSPGKGPIPTSIFIWDLQPPHWDATSPLFKLSSLWHFVTVALENEHPLEVPNNPGSERLLQGKGTHRNHSVWSFHDPWRNSIWNGPPTLRVRDWLRSLGSWLLGGVPFFYLAVLLVRRYIHIPIHPYIAQSSRLFVTPWTLCSPPGFSIYGILQARILEWIAISSSRGSSRPRDRTQVSHIAGRRFNLWATREARGDTWGKVNIIQYKRAINLEKSRLPVQSTEA